MISINQVSMYYPQQRRIRQALLRPFSKRTYFHALENIDLDIRHGDRVAFLGANGAGKTTLLKLVGGLLYPTRGNIRINGYDTVKSNLEARKSVGFVLNEERSFYWRLTGWQNLEFFAALENMVGTRMKKRVNELIDLVGLSESAHKLVATYSSGMKQRLAIARGLLSDPGILILDEPTKALDPVAVQQVKELITDNIHQDKKRTLLIATHSFGEAESLCNRVCIMKKGSILSERKLAAIQEESSLYHFYKQTIEQDKLV